MSEATATREKPVLFSAPMVRAILEGRKTQTRRVVKPQPDGVYVTDRKHANRFGIEKLPTNVAGQPWWSIGGVNGFPQCPYGAPGDRLWVRETLAQPVMGDCKDASLPFARHSVVYRADVGKEFRPLGGNYTIHERDCKWRPSIHMPRWASRITLEVTDVRVERLQEISDDDVQSEGTLAYRSVGETWYAGKCQDIFRQLWDSINGKSHPWASNPWVFVISFRRIEQ